MPNNNGLIKGKCQFCGREQLSKRMDLKMDEITEKVYVECPRCFARGPMVSYPMFASKLEAAEKAIISWEKSNA